MITAWLIPVLVAQDAEEWFRLQAIRSATATRILVAADRSAAPATEALRRLARRMRWNLDLGEVAVRDRLARTTIDLVFARQRPLDVARWIALTAGVEARFEQQGRVPRLRIVATRALSKAELRARAKELFTRVLEDPKSSSEERLEGMMGLARLHADAGESELSIRWFRRVTEQDSEQLHTAVAWLELAKIYERRAERIARSPEERQGDLLQAQRYARHLSGHADLELRAKGLRILARSLRSAGRWTDALAVLAAGVDGVRKTRTYPELRVLEASCLWQTGAASRALVVLDRLGRGKRSWTLPQWRRFHLCRGLAAMRVPDRREDAIRSLERFLGSAPAIDGVMESHSDALLALGDCYLATRRYLDAKAAVEHLLRRPVRLAGTRLEAARILEARVACALGERELARRRLRLAIAGRGGTWQKATTFLQELEFQSPAATPPSLAEMFARARRHERAATAAAPDQAPRERELAFDLYRRIERLDVVRGRDGEPRPGPWGVAARGARRMMEWADASAAWRRPAIPRPPR